MADSRAISPSDLLIDAENPRLVQPNTGQRDALREVAEHQGRKLLTLAEDILVYGPNPAELPIVMPLNDDRKRYVVLEGNRRLAALKVLENPELVVGAVDAVVVQGLRALSKRYQEDPVQTIQCVVVKTREDAKHWIELKHTGQNEGAGTVPWGSDESTRFRSRSKGLEPHSLVLNFLEDGGHLTPALRSKVPAASLKRLMGTPEVREKCGIDVEDGKLLLLGDEKHVAKALMYVANALVKGDIATKDIYTKPQRVDLANNLPASVVVKPTIKSGEAVPVSSQKTKPEAKPARRKSSKPRDVLIPRDCTMTIGVARIRDIETELRGLSLEDFTNAVSVLFRVFLELSLDSYISTRGLSTAPGARLSGKLNDVCNDLVSRQKLNPQQAKPVRIAAQRHSYLGPSITLMHDYVHNLNKFPGPSDLRADWNSLQAFMVAIWSK